LGQRLARIAAYRSKLRASVVSDRPRESLRAVHKRMLTGTPLPDLEFDPIPPDEMGFAMALFVSAANGRLSSSGHFRSSPTNPNLVCEQLFLRLLFSDDLAATTPKPIVIKDDLNLYSIFRTLWERYEDDDRQISVCARVLAFHFLMERTAGAVVATWLKPCPSGPEAVFLDPAVVEALAGICLLKNGLLCEDHFLNEVESHGVKKAHSRVPDKHRPAQHGLSPVSDLSLQSFPFGHDGSRLLAERLLAYEAISVGDGMCAASSVCKKLEGSFASLAGSRSFASLTERARTLTKRDSGTVVSMTAEADGAFQGLAYEDDDAAAIFIGHLISLPYRLIGAGLTRRVLQDAWPELLTA
jgi:hypothetical protein